MYMLHPEIETMQREDMRKLQLERLKETVEKVYDKVPFYREKFNELGITPQDIQSLDDITKLPFTVKQDLRDTYPTGLFASPIEDVIRIHGSSGTSGKPTIVGYTRKDIDTWSDILARGIATAGGKSSDIFHNAYGYGLFTGGVGLHYGVERLGAAVIPISGGNTERQATIIKDLRPRGIAGTPSYILNVAELLEQDGIKPEDNGLEYGIFGAEPWTEEMRAKIEEKLGIKAIDIYGLSEVMGPGVGIECYEAQSGLHLADDHFFVEVIDPDTGEAVPEGQEGELVITSLTKEALPVIRYRTGDISSVTYEKCKCGRTTSRMSRVKGRTDDMMIIRGVNVFPSEIERELMLIKELSPHYQIHLVTKGNMDAVHLDVELSPEVYAEVNGDLDAPLIHRLRREIQHTMKNSCLISVGVEIKAPAGIPRFESKAVRLVDHREA